MKTKEQKRREAVARQNEYDSHIDAGFTACKKPETRKTYVQKLKPMQRKRVERLFAEVLKTDAELLKST